MRVTVAELLPGATWFTALGDVVEDLGADRVLRFVRGLVDGGGLPELLIRDVGLGRNGSQSREMVRDTRLQVMGGVHGQRLDNFFWLRQQRPKEQPRAMRRQGGAR